MEDDVGTRGTGHETGLNRPKLCGLCQKNYLIIPGHMVHFILIAASWVRLLQLIQSPGLGAVHFLCAA